MAARMRGDFKTFNKKITQLSGAAVTGVMLLSIPSGTSKEHRAPRGGARGGEHFEAA
jgi:hypothetical protein